LLSYYKSKQTTAPLLGALDLQDMISVEDVKVPKSKSEQESCFQLVTSRRTILFKCENDKDKKEWMILIEAARQITSPHFLKINTKLPDSSLAWVLTRESIKHLKETINQELPVTIEESLHSYQVNSKFKKIIRVEGAEKILVIFDTYCDTHKYDILRFFKDISMNEIIGTFSGKGPSCFPPVVIESDHFWMTFNSSSSPSSSSQINKWGYKFYVTPLSMKLRDDIILKNPSFDFAFCVMDWLLNLTPVWVREFYCVEVYDALVSHLNLSQQTQFLNKQVKVINCLRRLLKRFREFPRESQPDLSKIKFLKLEMFELYDKEREVGECLHSVYLQKLIELNIQVEIVEAYQVIYILFIISLK
jgi:hypothetical protein